MYLRGVRWGSVWWWCSSRVKSLATLSAHCVPTAVRRRPCCHGPAAVLRAHCGAPGGALAGPGPWGALRAAVATADLVGAGPVPPDNNR